MIICIQCAMKHLIANGLQGAAYPGEPDATPALHAARVHPDLAATRLERQQLEAQLTILLQEGK